MSVFVHSIPNESNIFAAATQEKVEIEYKAVKPKKQTYGE